MAYMFSYYGIACSILITLINYVFLGLQFPVDGFYMHSWEIWLAVTVVFTGSGNLAYTLVEYRLGEKKLSGHFGAPFLHQYYLVGNEERGREVEFLQGDPEDRKEVSFGAHLFVFYVSERVTSTEAFQPLRSYMGHGRLGLAFYHVDKPVDKV
ncbi:hypothetical protein V5O48_007379 [Marasmius crinis-equi]|uniref:Uncharacterized protein n=1 Tax=Marasmius crinis-equi TaxID=585013 RepID=A0ABR3FH24_9AGAR